MSIIKMYYNYNFHILNHNKSLNKLTIEIAELSI